MMNSEKLMDAAAASFAERWKDRGYERGESQPFWIDLLTNVYGVENPSDGFITFEDHRAVIQAYGFPVKSTFTESQCMAELFKMYKQITK